jgi:serine/threonine-protein kinase
MLERCLEKDARNRCHDIADVRLDIEKILADPEGVLVQKAAAEEQRTSMRRMLPWLAATLILTAVVAGAAVWYLKPAPELKGPLITRFPLEADGFGVNHGMALSADGSKLVYAADKDGVRQLFLRARDQMAAVPIRDTKDAVHPFFSPDGNWVGFFNGTEIKKVSLSGGLAQTLCKAGDRYGASWGPDGTIVFSTSDSPGLMRVSASGGEPKPLTKPDTGSGWHHWPEFMPDGKAVLFTILKGPSDWQVAVLSLKTNTSRVLISGTDAHFASSGHLVFAREGSLWAVPFDSSRLELKGESVPIVEDVRVNTGGWAHYGLANDGSLVYLPGTTQTLASRLTWVDRKGKEEPIAAPSNQYGWPRISPDGTRLALGVRDTSGNYDIWTWEFARGTLTQLTFDAKSSNPLWTPDGKRIVFRSSRDGNPAVYWKAADGTGEDEKLGSVPNRVLIPYSWSGNGKTLVSIESAGGKADIVALSMEGDRARKVLLHEKHSETSPQASPDGQWLAYVSDESGPYKVYVRPFPEVNKGKWPISISGGDWPIWSRDGRELFYRSGDAIMALAVKTEPTFTAGKPEVLFKGVINPWNESSSLNFWDISPDGKRFLLVRSVESDAGASAAATPAKINVVLNFFEELKQKAP